VGDEPTRLVLPEGTDALLRRRLHFSSTKGSLVEPQ
jgi:hypothetical protein